MKEVTNENKSAKLKTPHIPTVRNWFLETINSRVLPSRLNELSASKHTIFSVNQSTHIGGSYEVLYYDDIRVLPEVQTED
jgi:hypothetical protein